MNTTTAGKSPLVSFDSPFCSAFPGEPLLAMNGLPFKPPDTNPVVKPRVRGGRRVREACVRHKAAKEAREVFTHKKKLRLTWRKPPDILTHEKSLPRSRGNIRQTVREISRREHDRLVKSVRKERAPVEDEQDLHPPSSSVRDIVKGVLSRRRTPVETIAWRRKHIPVLSLELFRQDYASHDEVAIRRRRDTLFRIVLYLLNHITKLPFYTPPKALINRQLVGDSSFVLKDMEGSLLAGARKQAQQFFELGGDSVLLKLIKWIKTNKVFRLREISDIDSYRKWCLDAVDIETERLSEARANIHKQSAKRRLSALRILLIIGGVEQNPGPPKNPAFDEQEKASKDASDLLERARQMGVTKGDLDGFFRSLKEAETTTTTGDLKTGTNPGCKGGANVKKQQPTTQVAQSQAKQPQAQQTNNKKQNGRGDNKSRRGGNRRQRANNAIAKSVMESRSESSGEMDALREKVNEKDEIIIDLREEYRNAAQEILLQDAMIQQARKLGFAPLPDNKPCMTYAFHGEFLPGNNSTFDDDRDPLVTVNVFPDGTWRSNADKHIMDVHISVAQLKVAVTSVSCQDKTLRLRNIYNGLVQSKAVAKEVDDLPYECKIEYLRTLELRAFLLTGTVVGTGKCRWMNDCNEWTSPKYYVEPPSDWQKRLKGVNWASDSQKFEADMARCSRAAPYVVQDLVPHVPDASDFGTLIAGLCKRLFPDLPKRDAKVLQKLSQISHDLADYIDRHQDPTDMTSVNMLVEEALMHHPAREREKMQEGVDQFLQDPSGATREYLDQPYKCFIKLESYPDGTFKPPRFIMSLKPKYRGVQVAAMAMILHKIEVGTRIANVKRLTGDQITQKLLEKFKNLHEAAETDFSSFESCIGPDLKEVVENQIFHALATTQPEHDFIDDALSRDNVTVLGPVFSIPQFHHIRMSGDYWTSLGNLVTNIVLSCYVTGRGVDEMLATGLFEGDDGVYPPPEDPEKVMRRALKAGVKLTFAIAPISCLSFCGNHFEYIDGSLKRFRDPQKCLANATILFNAPRTSLKHDRMLQRSKIMPYLDGPIIPDMWVFACVVERFTRDVRIDPKLLIRMGMAKMYSQYSIEECVPRYLQFFFGDIPLSDSQFCTRVFRMNKQAGGSCSHATIVKMVEAARSAGVTTHCVLPNPLPLTSSGAWYARDGARYSHKEGYLFPRVVENVNRFTNAASPVPVISMRPYTGVFSARPLFRFRKFFEILPHIEYHRGGVKASHYITFRDLLPLLLIALSLVGYLWWSMFAAFSIPIAGGEPHNSSMAEPVTFGQVMAMSWLSIAILAISFGLCVLGFKCARRWRPGESVKLHSA